MSTVANFSAGIFQYLLEILVQEYSNIFNVPISVKMIADG
jgi:hypothetical protein